MELLAWGNTVMEPHLFTIAPGAGSGDSYAHEGEEFIYVLRGVLNIALEGQWYQLVRATVSTLRAERRIRGATQARRTPLCCG